MSHIQTSDGTITVIGDSQRLLCSPRLLTVTDHEGNAQLTVAHETQEADVTIASVWATDLGDCYVEAMYPGEGPAGSELVVVVPADNAVIIGDLMADGTATNAWATALDLVLSLTDEHTAIVTSAGPVSRDDLDRRHQQLLGQILG